MVIELGDYRSQNILRPREYSRGNVTDGSITLSQRQWQPLRPVPLLEWREVELELQLARERLERQQPGGSARLLSSFLPGSLSRGVFFY